jgi:hypothetical protein
MGTAKVIDLALEYDELLADGEKPDLRAFLGKVDSPEDKSDLLVQLLALEAGYAPWNPAALKTRLNEFKELRDDPNPVLEVLRLVYADRVIAREPVQWAEFLSFGIDASTFRLVCPGEGHYLGEKLHGRYLLEERIGAGTFGVVFRASDLERGHTVAVKTPHYPRVPALGLSMLCREVEVVAKLSHPAIVPITSSYTNDPDTACLVMKYLEGGSLLYKMRKRVFKADEAVPLLLPVVDALAHAHKQTIFHRDVKPENILFDVEGNSHISDFGFALSMDEQWNKEGEIAGTFAYMAPELLLGSTHEIDGRSDVWSVGMILFEMLTGVRFARDNTREEALAASLVHGNAAQELLFPEHVPPGLRRVCERCLRRDPNLRYHKAEELAAEMTDVIGGTHIKRSEEGGSLKTAQTLTASWQIGTKLGLAFFDTRKYEAAIRNVQAHLPAGNEKLPRQLIAAIGEAAMHQVASMNHYEGCAQAAQGLGIELSALPEEQRKCSSLIYQASKLTSDRIRELPKLAERYLTILLQAGRSLKTSLRGIGPGMVPLFEMAFSAAGPMAETSGTQFKQHAEQSGVPEAVWISFLEMLLRNADEGKLREAFNQLDKHVQRYLIHHRESEW